MSVLERLAGAGVKRLIICGGRDFADHEVMHTMITEWIVAHGWPTEVVTGGASGADAMGHAWAQENGIKATVFPAEWRAYGRRAGPMRNSAMAAYAAELAGGCLALPGGRGTADMVRQARAAGLTVHDVAALEAPAGAGV